MHVKHYTYIAFPHTAIRPEVNGVILQFPDSMRIPASHLQLASYPIGQGKSVKVKRFEAKVECICVHVCICINWIINTFIIVPMALKL